VNQRMLMLLQRLSRNIKVVLQRDEGGLKARIPGRGAPFFS
jgi:hypothetical protein